MDSTVWLQTAHGQLLSINVERLRGGLVFQALTFLYHSTLGSRVVKKQKKVKHCEMHITRSVSGEKVGSEEGVLQGRCKATWKRTFRLSWREAGPPNHLNDKVDSDQ